MKTRVEVVLDDAEVQLVKEYQTNNQCASFSEREAGGASGGASYGGGAERGAGLGGAAGAVDGAGGAGGSFGGGGGWEQRRREAMKKDLWRFGDVALDLSRVVLVAGERVWMDDGKEYGIGKEAADAVLAATPRHPAWNGPSRDTCGREQGYPHATPASGQNSSREEVSAAVRVQLPFRSSAITSFPGDKAPMEDAATATPEATEKA